MLTFLFLAPFGMRGRSTSIVSNPVSGGGNISVPAIKHFLTMGHQLQELTYDPSSDTIEVIRFNEKRAQNDESNTYSYQYLLYSPLTQKYTKVVQVRPLPVQHHIFAFAPNLNFFFSTQDFQEIRQPVQLEQS